MSADKQAYENAITTDLVGLLIFDGALEYERKLERGMSGALGLKYGNDDNIYGGSYRSVGAEGTWRFFPLANIYRYRGVWFGPSLEAVNYHWSVLQSDTVSATYLNVFLKAGWQFAFGAQQRILLSPFIYAGYGFGTGATSLVYAHETHTFFAGGFRAMVGCSLGLGF